MTVLRQPVARHPGQGQRRQHVDGVLPDDVAGREVGHHHEGLPVTWLGAAHADHGGVAPHHVAEVARGEHRGLGVKLVVADLAVPLLAHLRAGGDGDVLKETNKYD